MSSVTALCPQMMFSRDKLWRAGHTHLITDVTTRLQAESSSETAVKYYCDEEMAKSAVKKERHRSR